MTLSLLYLFSYFSMSNLALEALDGRRLTQRMPSYSMQVQIGPEIQYKNFGVSFVVDTYLMGLPETPYTQAPFQTIYTTNFFYRGKSFEVGYEHQCVHPTVSIRHKQQVSRYGGYDKFYIKGKVTLQGGR